MKSFKVLNLVKKILSSSEKTKKLINQGVGNFFEKKKVGRGFIRSLKVSSKRCKVKVVMLRQITTIYQIK